LRVLLTGGVGYLGGRLARFLIEREGHEVLLGTRAPQRVPNWAADHRVVHTDWNQEATLARACAGVDAIVHLSGMNARDCAEDPVAALEVNGVGTAHLLRAACREQVRRFIYLSSAHVYGGALTGRVDEGTAAEPRHPYATSHRAAEDLVRHAQYSGRIEGVVVRLSNSYGAPADPGADCWSLLTNDLALQAVRSGRLVLRTTGEQRRDFIPLAEACRALAHLLAVPAAVLEQEVINVGGGWALMLREMAALIAERSLAVLGLRPELCIGDRTDATGSGLLAYGIARLLATGFKPDATAREAELDQLLRFCQEHRESLP
jgi:UDP-glucose 4-epimerase